MKMYVANCTQQVQNFIYRLPETAGTRQQEIGIGSQIQISGDLNQKQIDAIVAQHSIYGMIRADEVDRTRAFVGICYAVDRKVDVDSIRRAAIHNQDVLQERGKQLRAEAAIAAHNKINEEDPGNPLKQLDVQITEEAKDGKEPEVNEGVTVVPNGTERDGETGRPRSGGKNKRK